MPTAVPVDAPNSAVSEPIPALPLAIAGQVTKVTGEVFVIRADGSAEQLQVGDTLQPGDTIQTADDAAIGFDLIDDSSVSLAGGSRMVLDEVIFDPESGEGSIQLSAMDGTFAVHGGQLADLNPKAMVVDTPFGTLSPGTSRVSIEIADGLDVLVMPSDAADFGDVLFRNNGGLLTLDQPFSFARIDGTGHIPEATVLASDTDIASRVRFALDHLPETNLSAGLSTEDLIGGSDNAFDIDIAAGTDAGNSGPSVSDRISVNLDDIPADRSSVPPVRLGGAVEGPSVTDAPASVREDVETPVDPLPAAAPDVPAGDGEPALPVTTVEITGTDRNNSITGTDANDLINGGAGNDNLRGGAGDDILNGDSGNDTLQGQAGDDVLVGGTGNNNLIGGDGADSLSGGGGNDTLQIDANDTFVDGGAGTDRVIVLGTEGVSLDLGAASIERAIGNVGDDTFDGSGLTVRADLRGGGGNDALTGGSANDILRGDDGDDVLAGGGGNDSFFGGTGSDSLSGGDGNDTLRGEAGNDVLVGGSGNDNLIGGDGADSLSGGDGNDTLQIEAGDTFVDGGAGNDRVIVQGANGVSLDLGAASIERAIGNVGDDTFDGSGLTVRADLRGGAGNDALTGGSANDILRGDDGDDALAGGGGNDSFFGGTGADSLSGGDGNDTLRGEAGNDVLLGGSGNDNLIGGDGADSLSGGDGNDTLQIDANDTFVDGGAGTDRVVVQGSGGISLDLGAASIERATGNVGDDTFDGSGLTVRADLRGGDGNDTLTGGSDRDTLRGDDGDDVLAGGGGDDNLTGGDGADSLSGGDGNDVLNIDANDILIDGGAGTDRIVVQGPDGINLDLGATNIERATGNVGNDTFDASGVTVRTDLRGGAGDDTLTGGSDRDTLRGDDGDDVLVGGGGNDNLTGGDGADSLSGGDGNDILNIDANDILIDGGAGTDRVVVQGADGINLDLGATNIERATGNIGNDNFDASGLTVRTDLRGGGGADILTGGSDRDSLRGDAGNDTLFGGKGRDTLNGGDGDDFLTGGDGNDLLIGGSGDDTFAFDADSGVDIIRDLEIGDALRFDGGFLLGDLQFSQVGDDTVVTFGSNSDLSVRIEDTDSSSLRGYSVTEGVEDVLFVAVDNLG